MHLWIVTLITGFIALLSTLTIVFGDIAISYIVHFFLYGGLDDLRALNIGEIRFNYDVLIALTFPILLVICLFFIWSGSSAAKIILSIIFALLTLSILLSAISASGKESGEIVILIVAVVVGATCFYLLTFSKRLKNQLSYRRELQQKHVDDYYSELERKDD